VPKGVLKTAKSALGLASLIDSYDYFLYDLVANL